MAFKEIIASAILSTSPENPQLKTVCDELSSCQKIVHQVMESKENPYKIDEKIMTLALKVSEKNPIKYDISKLPHTAQLSQDIMNKYFMDKNNKVIYPKINPTGEISRNDPKPIYKGNLQYLVGETGMGTYLTLSKEHQKVIQDLANILLTDEYAENIADNSKIDGDNFIIIDGDLDTFSLSDFLERSIYILRGIQGVERGIDKNYNVLLKDLEEYKKHENIKQMYDKLLTFKPKIEAIKEVFKNLDKQNYKNEMDFRKREVVINKELKKAKEELNKKYGIIIGLQGEVQGLQGEVQGLQGEVQGLQGEVQGLKKLGREKDIEIRKLVNYINTLRRLHRITGISQ